MQATITRTSYRSDEIKEIVEISNLEDLLNLMREVGEPLIIDFPVSEEWLNAKSEPIPPKYDRTKLEIEIYDDYRE